MNNNPKHRHGKQHDLKVSNESATVNWNRVMSDADGQKWTGLQVTSFITTQKGNMHVQTLRKNKHKVKVINQPQIFLKVQGCHFYIWPLMSCNSSGLQRLDSSHSFSFVLHLWGEISPPLKTHYIFPTPKRYTAWRSFCGKVWNLAFFPFSKIREEKICSRNFLHVPPAVTTIEVTLTFDLRERWSSWLYH